MSRLIQIAEATDSSRVTVTAFYPSNGYAGLRPAARETRAYPAASISGFGCLFPRDQGFRARGVLFNNSIFEGRGPAHSEAWIFGGALDADITDVSDDQFRELIATERERFYGKRDEPLALYINRRPKAIPHYTIELEQILTNLPAPPANVALVGNYLGRIGLAKLIERAALVAEEMALTFGLAAA